MLPPLFLPQLLVNNQPQAPSYWSRPQGGASIATLVTLLTASQLWLKSRELASQRRTAVPFLRHWPLISHLLLWWRREKPGESSTWEGRRHRFLVAVAESIQCYLGLWRGRHEVRQANEKYSGVEDFFPKSWGSQRNLNQENGMKISGRTLCVKGECGWRDTIRRKKKEEKKINNTRFLMCNCFM